MFRFCFEEYKKYWQLLPLPFSGNHRSMRGLNEHLTCGFRFRVDNIINWLGNTLNEHLTLYAGIKSCVPQQSFSYFFIEQAGRLL